MYLALAASQLHPDEFLVRTNKRYVTRDPVKEHAFEYGEVFLIDQVRSLNDGSGDAWLCGYRLQDTAKEHKWIFSQYTSNIFS